MQEFQHLLRQIRQRQNSVIGLRYFLAFLAVVLMGFFLFFSVYLLAPQQPNLLFLLALTLKVSIALFGLYSVMQGIRCCIDETRAARMLDRRRGDENDTFQNAVELSKQDIEPEFLSRILAQANAEAAELQPFTDFAPVKHIWMPVAAMALLAVALFGFFRQDASTAYRYFTLRSIPAVEHKTTVEVAPGSVQIPRLSDLTIEVLNPEEKVEHLLYYRRDAVWRQEPLKEGKHRFAALDFSFDYQVRTPWAASDTFRVEVFEKPMITSLDLRYDYPAYTGLPSRHLPDASGVIQTLQGTTVGFRFEANNPLQDALCIFDDGEVVHPRRIGRQSYEGEFIVQHSGGYQLKLTDVLGSESHPVMKSITALPDKIPVVEIVIPGRDTVITQNMVLPLRIDGADDFGITDVTLHFMVDGTEEQRAPLLASIPETMFSLDHLFDLSTLRLIPGDEVVYWVSVTDNRPEPQTGESRRYRARFPSIEEIYEEVAKADEERQAGMMKTREEAEELKQDVEEKRRELMRKEDVSWEDKEDVKALLERQEAMQKNVQEMSREYQQMVKKMEENRALSEQTLEKMQRIQELMEEIHSDELMKAMEEMQKRMDSMNPEEMKKAMDQMKFSMDEFLEKLDNTLQMLEDIKKEQAVQKALNIAKEMERMQQELNKQTEAGEDMESLAEDQQQINDKLEALQDQLMKMEDMMSSPKDAALQDSLQAAMETAMDDSLQQNMEQSAQSMKNGDRQQASSHQQQASRTLKRLREQLENMQSMMNSSMQMDTGAAIDAAIRRLLIFSDIHENISSRYVQDPFVILPDLIATFEGMNLTLQDLYRTPMIILTLGPKFMYDASAVARVYRELFTQINDAQNSMVATHLSNIQKGLNLMIFDLMQSKSNSQQGGGGGMQSLMQSLKQMGQQQMMMNMMTRQMMQQMMRGDGKMSREMRQQAQRLARQEEQMAENLRRMLQTNKAAQKQTGALRKMADDLEDIARNLRRNRIDQNLIDTQERILSRLLDARKSIHKREFSKERKAETSDKEWTLPQELKRQFDTLQHKALLKEDLQNYPPEYRELIQEYLQKLNDKINNQERP